MKLNALFLLPFLFSQLHLFAVDRVVQEMGPTGTFGSIGAAVTSANDGDRIVIHNRLGGLAWVENVNISKELTFVSAVAGTRFLVAGDYTVATTTPGKTIRIVGMENQAGDIGAQSDAPGGARTRVQIVGSDLTGTISFNFANFDVVLATSDLTGNIFIGFGGLYGNEIAGDTYLQNVNDIPSNDIIMVVGNKFSTGSGGTYGVYLNTSAHFFQVTNNIINGHLNGVFVQSMKPASIHPNLIVNNSIRANDGVEVIVSSASGAELYIENNAITLFGSFSGSDGIQVSSSANYYHFVGYNHIENDFQDELVLGGSAVGVPTNVIQSVTFSSIADGSVFGAGVVDAGNPDRSYFDHDLTPNNPGAQGGSLSINNYFPRAGGPTVFRVVAPRIQYQGTPINVEAEGFVR